MRHFQFSYIHGISWTDVQNEKTFKEIWPELTEWFEGIDFVCAHNAGFDRRVLEACCVHYDLTPPKIPYHCTVKLAREAWDLYPTNLPRVCEFLGIELNHHEALSDAKACAKIAIQALERTPSLILN